MAISLPENFSLDKLKRVSDGLKRGDNKEQQILESLCSRRNELNSESLKALSKFTELENTCFKQIDKFHITNAQVIQEELTLKKLVDDMEEAKRIDLEIESEIQRVQDNATQNLLEFENQIDELSKLFANAELFYAPSNMEVEFEEVSKRIEEISHQKETYLAEIANLRKSLEETPTDINDNLKIALQLVKEENQQLKVKFNEKMKIL